MPSQVVVAWFVDNMNKIKAYAFTNGVDKKEIRKDIEKNPEAFLLKTLTISKFNFGVDNITRFGVYKEMGWAYHLQGYLKKYVYKQYGQWNEIYALNKQNVRFLVGGKIDRIVEL